MAEKTKFFRVAVEGATTDGRVIERAWIDQMAASYNPATFTASINCEHIRGFSPEPPFNSYGRIVALKADDVVIELNGVTSTKRALFAQIEPNDQLKAINAKGQKLFTSIEVNPNFAQSGAAYCVGLAVTDDPASLGTERLAFNASQGAQSALSRRKLDPNNLFTATGGEVLDLALEAAPAAPVAGGGMNLAQSIMALFSGGHAPAAPTAPVAPLTPVQHVAPAANDNDAKFTAALVQIAQTIDANATTAAQNFAQLQTSLASLNGQLSETPATDHTPRPAATGASFTRTDC